MSEDVETVPTSPASSLKRPRDVAEDISGSPSTPTSNRRQSSASSTLSTPQELATPKGMSTISSTLANGISNLPSQLSLPKMAPKTSQTSSIAPTKKRKLNPQDKAEKEAEKLLKAAEKEAKTQQKEEERRRKAEERELEKRQKEEERQAKEEEKQQKAQEKEIERKKKLEEKEQKQALKDFEKLQKEEEKGRRERSQMRLSSFFGVPTNSPPAALSTGSVLKAGTSPLKHAFITKEQARQRSMSQDPVDLEFSNPSKVKALSNASVQAKNSPRNCFLPFVLGKGMTLAPYNHYLPSEDELVLVNAALDSCAESPPKLTPKVIETFVNDKSHRGYQPPSAQEIMRELQISSTRPTALASTDNPEALAQLKSLPMKHLFFWEDVRPHYRGTWTRAVPASLARKLARNPFAQELTEINYDYDSEAEWEDADDGEDIADADENEEEDDEEEDMDEFIDDDNAPQYLGMRKAPPSNDVQAKCSGIQWEDALGRLNSADPSFDNANFNDLSICFLLDPSPKTIDPFTTLYWDPEPKQLAANSTIVGQLGLMGPPRPPLQDRTNENNVQTTLVNGKVPKATKVGPKKVPAEVLPDFKAAIEGQDLTKIGMIEALKKQFPKLTKEQITSTLDLVAERKGAKLADKRWVLKIGVQV